MARHPRARARARHGRHRSGYLWPGRAAVLLAVVAVAVVVVALSGDDAEPLGGSSDSMTVFAQPRPTAAARLDTASAGGLAG